MHRRPSLGDDERGRSPISPVATGIALGLWVALMLIIAFVIVPTLFSLCAPPGTTGGAGP
ncbi:MAG TPA: hypothetical protein VGQ86_11360 [Candidatus Limnocylindria bacterium]|nr:hypothetical protein [Candidatus Limnocylindria bacterium]